MGIEDEVPEELQNLERAACRKNQVIEEKEQMSEELLKKQKFSG